MLAGGKLQNESFNSGESSIHRSYNGKNEYRKKTGEASQRHSPVFQHAFTYSGRGIGKLNLADHARRIPSDHDVVRE